MAASSRTARKLADLKAVLRGKASMLIGLQDNPDPDALGAAAALRRLANLVAGCQCSLTCGGTVGRGENRALVKYLDLNLRPMSEVDPARFEVIALVDTQPGTGNNSLPEGVQPHVVIDHHPMRRRTRTVPFTDIRRRYGSTCTILYEYLAAAGIEPQTPLATAMLYGLRSDTQDLGREATRADMDAYQALYPLANKRMLGTIQRGQVPSAYFRALAAALGAARICGTCIYCPLGDLENPDMPGELADLLLRHDEAVWSLVWGRHEGRLLLSVRTEAPDGQADKVVHAIVSRHGTGGGHRTMAGGQVPLRKTTATYRDKLDTLIRKRFVKATGNDLAASRRLVS